MRRLTVSKLARGTRRSTTSSQLENKSNTTSRTQLKLNSTQHDVFTMSLQYLYMSLQSTASRGKGTWVESLNIRFLYLKRRNFWKRTNRQTQAPKARRPPEALLQLVHMKTNFQAEMAWLSTEVRGVSLALSLGCTEVRSLIYIRYQNQAGRGAESLGLAPFARHGERELRICSAILNLRILLFTRARRGRCAMSPPPSSVRAHETA